MKILCFCGLLIIGFIGGLRAQTVASQNGTIKVTVTGFRNGKGNILVSLYNKDKGFPRTQESVIQSREVKVMEAGTTVEFTNVVPGTYAISTIHDEDGNREMDSNFLGMPKEGVGTSNNPKSRMGPPSYKDAQFVIKAGETKTMTIKMVYLL